MLPSLPEVYRSVPIAGGASFLRKMLAFAGPGYLVAVGYMDPGNWATDIGGGSGLRGRAETAFRHPAARRRLDYRHRRADRAGAARPRVSLDRSAGDHPDRNHRRLLRL